MPMQSRSDQIQSYQFFVQRVISGLVSKESDPAELPFRRLGWSGFGGIMIAALVTAGFGVYGILVGGAATSWRDGESVIVEKETGTNYIYRDDRLYPMANVTSAQLAIGGGGESTRVSARSLAGVPRGPLLGIPGAPPSLPEGLLTGGWSFCTQRVPDGRGGWDTVSVLGVGRAPAGGTVLADADAVLVRDAYDAEVPPHLVWNGHRFAITEPEPVLRALGSSRSSALPVAPAWLDSLPVGDPLGPPRVAERGGATTAFGDVRDPPDVHTGQVVEAQGKRYLVREAELVELTPLQADVVLAQPATGQARAQVLGPGDLSDARIDPLPPRTATSPPESRPVLARLGPDDIREAAVCAGFAPGELTPQVLAGARLPGAAGWLATPGHTEQGVRLADYVGVDGGSAALVLAAASPEASGGAVYLVTDQGVRYALPSPEVAGALGLDPRQLVRLPAGLLARLPAGPALDRAQALLPVPSVAGTAP